MFRVERVLVKTSGNTFDGERHGGDEVTYNGRSLEFWTDDLRLRDGSG